MSRHKGFRKARRRAKHGASPYEQWRGTPIAAKHARAEKCTSFGERAKVCVYGAKYGFSAWLVSKATGAKGAPIHVPSSARTPDAALKFAVREARRVSRISRGK